MQGRNRGRRERFCERPGGVALGADTSTLGYRIQGRGSLVPNPRPPYPPEFHTEVVLLPVLGQALSDELGISLETLGDRDQVWPALCYWCWARAPPHLCHPEPPSWP